MPLFWHGWQSISDILIISECGTSDSSEVLSVYYFVFWNHADLNHTTQRCAPSTLRPEYRNQSSCHHSANETSESYYVFVSISWKICLFIKYIYAKYFQFLNNSISKTWTADLVSEYRHIFSCLVLKCLRALISMNKCNEKVVMRALAKCQPFVTYISQQYVSVNILL